MSLFSRVLIISVSLFFMIAINSRAKMWSNQHRISDFSLNPCLLCPRSSNLIRMSRRCCFRWVFLSLLTYNLQCTCSQVSSECKIFFKSFSKICRILHNSVNSRQEYKYKYRAKCTSKSFQGMHWSTHTSAVWSAHKYTNTNTVLDILQRVLKECTPVQCDQHTNREGAEPRLTALSTRQNSTLTAWALWAGFKWRMALFLPLPDFCTLPVYIRTLWNYSCCFLPSHIMSEQDGISTGRVWIIKINHMYHEIEYINYIFQRQSEDYDDYSDGPTQDPISAQLGLVADSNRCSIFIF